MNTLITICARGGSKGIPRKNIRDLAGKPVISYTVECAKKLCNRLDSAEIALSTDDEEIRTVVNQLGIYSDYHRPERLANDTVGKVEVIHHLLEYEEEKSGKPFDYIIDLDVSAPLRKVSEVLEAFEKIKSDPEALNIFSVNKADKNPYYNMVEKKSNGYFHLVKKPDKTVYSRQTVPAVYQMNASFYIYSRAFFQLGFKSPITDRSLIYEMNHISFDLDEPFDLELMNYMFENNKLDFNLLD